MTSLREFINDALYSENGVVVLLDDQLDDVTLATGIDLVITAVVEWLRLEDTKKAIYAGLERTGTGPPLVSITEALVRAAREEP